MKRPIRLLVCALSLMSLGACADLAVENPNAPDQGRALSTPGDVESLIAGSFRTFYVSSNSYFGPGMVLGTMGNEWTSSWGNAGMRDYSSEPRTAFNNNNTYGYAYAIRDAWYNMYKAVKGASDGLRSINDGLKITAADGSDATPRAEAWAHFVMGISYGLLSNLYDQAFAYDETVDLTAGTLDLQDYKQINDFAMQHLDKAIQIASANSFTIPENWVGPPDNGVRTTSADLARVAHSYAARYLAQNARNPTERAAVDWTKVIAHVDAGMTQNWGPIGDAYNDWDGDPIQYYGVEQGWARMDLQSLGVADVSGEYQTWMATPLQQRTPFLITTPDRRVTGPGGPTESGTYVKYHATIPFAASRGTYHFSNYSGEPQYEEIKDFGTGPLPAVDADELRLLKAEGLYRKGDKQGAADLVNVTRVANGQLPAVDVNGPPPAADCVPKRPDGQCGDLFDALKYEKLLEAWVIAPGVRFFDERGWGELVKGTPEQMPIPGKELEVLQLPYYTFGGSEPSAAPGGVYGRPLTLEQYIGPTAVGVTGRTSASAFAKFVDMYRPQRGAPRSHL